MASSFLAKNKGDTMRAINFGLVKSALHSAVTPWEISTVVVSFVADFLKPEANIAPYLLVGFVIILIILLVLFR